MTSPLSPACALVIVPPPEVRSYIQQFHSGRVSPNCKELSYARWMPHIKIAYPFLSPSSFASADMAHRIADSIRALSPFVIQLGDTVVSNSLGSKTTMNQLSVSINDSTGGLSKLRETITAILGSFESLPLQLSLGQCQTEKLGETISVIQSALQPQSFTVNEVSYITRSGNEPFDIKESFTLEGPSTIDNHSVNKDEGEDEDDDTVINAKPNTRTSLASQRVKSHKKKSTKQEMEIVLNRVAGWLDHRNCVDHLPKTKVAFQTAISKMCIVNGNDSEELAERVLQSMETKGWIYPAKRSGFVKYQLDAIVETPTVEVKESAQEDTKPKSDEEMLNTAFNACTSWIIKTDQRPTTRKGVLRVFDQLCQISTRIEVNAEQVVFQLIARRVIKLVDCNNNNARYRSDAQYIQYLTLG